MAAEAACPGAPSTIAEIGSPCVVVAARPSRRAIAAGASMLRGQEALPFKDVIRNFDCFTQSVIQALVTFNKKFNPELTPNGDFNVLARGATSLIAKELRGMYADQLAQSLERDERHDGIGQDHRLHSRTSASQPDSTAQMCGVTCPTSVSTPSRRAPSLKTYCTGSRASWGTV